MQTTKAWYENHPEFRVKSMFIIRRKKQKKKKKKRERERERNREVQRIEDRK